MTYAGYIKGLVPGLGDTCVGLGLVAVSQADLPLLLSLPLVAHSLSRRRQLDWRCSFALRRGLHRQRFAMRCGCTQAQRSARVHGLRFCLCVWLPGGRGAGALRCIAGALAVLGTPRSQLAPEGRMIERICYDTCWELCQSLLWGLTNEPHSKGYHSS